MASKISDNHPSGLYQSQYDCVLTTTDPQGNITYEYLPDGGQADKGGSNAAIINLKFNSLISQGYKLIATDTDNQTIATRSDYTLGTWHFAIPRTSGGLEEVTTTLNSLSISPNPANELVNISLSYDLKGESETVFISEAGYVYHKESIASISKNETYNIDISRIPAGKYLVTIKNGKTYTTPQKLIVL
tara:strand:+ start:6415 stop:6981 length:567 start_codon:yes stop_codon:yes gene_type:complete